MHDNVRLVMRSVLLVLQVLGVLYLAFVCWLFTVWMVDDSWAFRATALDWWREAAIRLAGGLAFGAVTALLMLVLNRLLVRFELNIARLQPWTIAVLTFGVIASAAAAGAVQFLVEKPYM